MKHILTTLKYKQCKICKLYYNDIEKICSACEEKQKDIEKVDIIYIFNSSQKKDFLKNMLNGVCPICGENNFNPQHIMRHIYKKHNIKYKNLINENFKEMCICGERRSLFVT